MDAQEPAPKRYAASERVQELAFPPLQRDGWNLAPSSETFATSSRAQEPTTTHLQGDRQNPEPFPARPATTRRVQEPTFTELEKDHKALYSELDREMVNLLNGLGSFVNMPDPMLPSPPKALRDLYARCLGPEWEATHRLLHDSNRLLLMRFAESLIAAFVFDEILDNKTLGFSAVIDMLEAKLINPDIEGNHSFSTASKLRH